MIVLAALLAIPIGGLGIFLALRTGSAEAVQGMFPLFFALMFFSSTFFPRETMTGWFQVGGRHQPDLAPGRGHAGADHPWCGLAEGGVSFAIIVVLGRSTVGACAISLRRRLEGDA